MIDVEMQMASHNGMAKRALYYACRMYSSELKVGELYDALRPAVVIFLLAEDLFYERPSEFELGYSLQQDDAGPVGFTELTCELRIKFYEILKAFRLWQERQLPSDDVSLGAWLGFLADPMSQAVEEACMSIPELKDAKNALEELSSEAEAREIARMREMARIHWDSIIAGAKAEGMAEGIAEGEAKGKAEGKAEASHMFLKALLSAPETKAFSDSRLAELTGLSVAEVAKVRAELK
jgi:predicted transposase/invertase (TIGR01784 family)